MGPGASTLADLSFLIITPMKSLQPSVLPEYEEDYGNKVVYEEGSIWNCGVCLPSAF